MAPTKTYRKKKSPIKKKMVKRRKKFEITYSLPFPARRRVRFNYSFVKHLSAATTSTTFEGIRLNGPFDPELSVGGSQPRYWDQLMGASLYTKYLVEKASYKITFINKSTSSDAVIAVLARRDTSTLPANAIDLWKAQEFKYTTVKTLLPLGQPNARVIIKGSHLISPLVSASRTDYLTDAQYQAAFSGNPATQVILTCMASDNPQSASGCAVDMYVSITYYCQVYSQDLDVAQS